MLIAASFFVALGFGIFFPVIPLFAKSFGVSNAAVGLLVSAFAIARFCSGLVAGRLVDLFGERSLYALGIFIVSLSAFLCAFAQNYGQLLFFRTAGGLGSSMFTVSAGSIIMRSVSDDQRGRAQSVYNGSFLIGGIAGPAIGGILSAISLRAPLLAYSFSLMIAGTIGFFFLNAEKTGIRKNEGDEVKMRIPEALRLAPYRSALVITFVTSWILLGLRSSILPLFVTEQLHSSKTVLGLGFAVTALFQGMLLLPAGTMSDERGRRQALLVGTSVVLVGSLIMVFAVHPWMFIGSMAVMGVGGAFLSTTPANIVGDVIWGKSGQVIALWQMAGDAGMIIGPLTVGFISDLFSYRTAFAVSAVVFAVSLPLSYRLGETRKSHLSN